MRGRVSILSGILVVACLVLQASCFSVNGHHHHLRRHTGLSTTTALNETPTKRRDVFRKLRQAIFGAATLAVFRKGPSIAFAEDLSTPTTGRIVELQVANLSPATQGSSMGTIKIQLRPEWAPRGVRRFEVCIIVRFESR